MNVLLEGWLTRDGIRHKSLAGKYSKHKDGVQIAEGGEMNFREYDGREREIVCV